MDILTPKTVADQSELQKNDKLGHWGITDEMLDYDAIIPNYKLPESVFVNIFLPIIYGEKEFVTHRGRDYTINDWINQAGGVGKEIDVHKDGNPNEILFSVPAFQALNNFEPVVGFKLKYNLDQAKLLNNISPVYGRDEQLKITTHLSEKMLKIENITDNMKRWDDIFKRYNRKTFFEQVNNYSPSLSNESNSDPDFDIMD